MNKRMRTVLKLACEPPKALKKEEFLRHMPSERISYGRFCLGQTAYIGKTVWILSLVTLGIIMIAWRLMPFEKIRLVAAFMPFLALSAVNESRRSQNFRMAELEMSTRFSLKSVVLARMEIIGATHLSLIVVAALICGADVYSAWQAGIYLLTPYFLVNSICLVIERRSRYGQEELLYAAVAAFVCAGQLMAKNFLKGMYEADNILIWAVVLACSALWCGKECRRNLRKTEESVWSLR